MSITEHVGAVDALEMDVLCTEYCKCDDNCKNIS